MKQTTRERQLERLLSSIASRPLTTLEKMDVRAFVVGGPDRSSVKLCECGHLTATECLAIGNC